VPGSRGAARIPPPRAPGHSLDRRLHHKDARPRVQGEMQTRSPVGFLRPLSARTGRRRGTTVFRFRRRRVLCTGGIQCAIGKMLSCVSLVASKASAHDSTILWLQGNITVTPMAARLQRSKVLPPGEPFPRLLVGRMS